MKILAIDPGTHETGWCVYNTETHYVTRMGITPNSEFKNQVKSGEIGVFASVACEMIASYGMPVGKEVFDTCVFIGNLQQVFEDFQIPFTLIYRKDVKMEICGTVKAKDGNIRQALIDEFPAIGDGKVPQIGTKKNPGPLYGVSSHVWPALAVAITHAKQSKIYKVATHE